MNIKKNISLGLILVILFPMLYVPFSVNAGPDQASNDYIIVDTIEYLDGTKEIITTRNGKTSIEIVGAVEMSTEAGIESPISIADNNPSAGDVGADSDCDYFSIYSRWDAGLGEYIYMKFVFHVWCEPKPPYGTDNLWKFYCDIYVSGYGELYDYDKSWSWPRNIKGYTRTVYRTSSIPTSWAGRSYEGYCWGKDDDSDDLDLGDGASETGSNTCYGTIYPTPYHSVDLQRTSSYSQTIYDNETAVYTFYIKNHGNLFSEQYYISCPGLDKASASYSKNSFGLSPGQSTTFSITLDPTDVGTDSFSVRAIAYTYGTTDSVSCSITIIDDDINPPIIQYTYTGDYTDGNPGEIIVTASDPSGLSVDHSGTYTVEPYLGTQDFYFTATDNDNDRPGEDDTETDTLHVPIIIVDDDILGPVIEYEYTGDETDGNPGFINVTASDPSGLSVDPSGQYPVSNILGAYDFTFTATDNDNDRPGEDDTTTETLEIPTINIIDDDIEEPYFADLVISDDHLWLNISFTGIDDLQPLGDGDEGLSNVEVYVDGNLIHSDSSSSYETVFDFSFPNDWIWVPGIHTIQIDITDADNDRISDSESNTASGQFEVTLDEMYQYVMWLCEEMNNYIYDNDIVALFGVVTQKLVKIQTLLWDAYQLIQDGYLHSGLVRQKMAEIKLEIAETKTELMISKQSMSQEHFDYLQDCIRNVRNKIVELMGLGISEFSHDIALAEIDVYNLRDFVEDNINATDSENLVNAITLTAEKLENAIFDISLDKSTEGSLTSAQNALDNAKTVVVDLARKGKISEELKLELLAKIIIIQVKIELLKLNI